MKTAPARSVLVPLLEPENTGSRPARFGSALFALGFRPLYLLGALFAALAIPLWIAQFAGVLPRPSTYPAMFWHAHEMTFGFALAVIVGFLLTGARAWTGLPTPIGRRLAVICALWIGARLFNYAGPAMLAMLFDDAFIVAAMLGIGSVLVKARNHRNLFVLVILGAFLVANTLFHLAISQRLDISPLEGARLFVFVVVMLICVIGGRVIPTFTANAIKGVRQWRNKALDLVSLIATGLALLLVLVHTPPIVSVPVCLAAAALQAGRLAGWNPWATRNAPILWVLHAGYAWIPIGLVLIALGELDAVSPSAGVHALTLGAIGGLIIGMITRTALGHTARPLRAGRMEITAYALVQLAVLLRLAPMLVPALPYLPWTVAAATAWSLAFGVYLVKYVPILASPRLDGREG